jgi:hypothetical protein
MRVPRTSANRKVTSPETWPTTPFVSPVLCSGASLDCTCSPAYPAAMNRIKIKMQIKRILIGRPSQRH